MRRANGGTSGVNSALETISAAATAIASAEARGPPDSAPKRRWGGRWSLYWCFRSHKQSKRIGHAVLVPEPAAPRSDVLLTENSTQPTSVALPFVAPPSSPASFLQSEPSSAMQSPAGLLSITSVSASMYSPGDRPSIFAIGPYAHETQLVSPPVFSTFTTEPSTAPFTPPPESVHLTTPSSPEVPFARLLDPNLRGGEAGQRFPLSHYEFQSYQLYPGSPVGHLISPNSGISGSGTSSPFPDREFAPVGAHHFTEFRAGEPPKLLNFDKLSVHERGSMRGSGSVTPDSVCPTPGGNFPLDFQTSEVAQCSDSENGWAINGTVVDHRVSFELTAEDVVRCVEKESTALSRAVSASLENKATSAVSEISSGGDDVDLGRQQHQKHRSITLGSIKEFDFDNADEHSGKANIGSNWWANERVVEEEAGPSKNWSFFPMLQPGVS